MVASQKGLNKGAPCRLSFVACSSLIPRALLTQPIKCCDLVVPPWFGYPIHSAFIAVSGFPTTGLRRWGDNGWVISTLFSGRINMRSHISRVQAQPHPPRPMRSHIPRALCAATSPSPYAHSHPPRPMRSLIPRAVGAMVISPAFQRGVGATNNSFGVP